MNTKVAADNGTVVEGNRIRVVGVTIGDSRCTADGTTGGCRGVCVVSRDFTTVKEDVGASVSSEQHTSGGCGVVIALDSQVLEGIVLHVHQSHSTVSVGTGIRMVVRDNHRVHIIALEGDGVHRRLPDIVLDEVKVGVCARPQMEHDRPAKTTEIQRLLDRLHIREIRVGTTHGVIPPQQTVAGIGGNPNSVVGVIAVKLPVTGVHIDRHVVVTVPRRKCSQRQGRRDIEANVTTPSKSGVVEQHIVLIPNLYRECTRKHSDGMVGGIVCVTSVCKIHFHILR